METLATIHACSVHVKCDLLEVAEVRSLECCSACLFSGKLRPGASQGAVWCEPGLGPSTLVLVLKYT